MRKLRFIKKPKIAKNYRPCKRFYRRKPNRETIKAMEEAEAWDYSKPTNITRKWGKFKVLTDYPSEISYVNKVRKKAKNGKHTKRMFFY